MEINLLTDFTLPLSLEKNNPIFKLDQPGKFTIKSIGKTNGIYMITIVWVDMFNITHEKTFERGDLFANFNKVLKAMTDYGFPLDPAKTEEFRIDLCRLSTINLRQNQGKPAGAPNQNQEIKSNPVAETALQQPASDTKENKQ